MSRSFFRRHLALIAAGVPLLSMSALAQSTAFTYQGEIASAGSSISGTADLVFRLFDVSTNGSPLGPVLCIDDVELVNGRFAATLDFGSVFAQGAPRYLEISLRDNSALSCADLTGMELLEPRQLLTSTPHAVQSLNAARLNNLDASNYSLTSHTHDASALISGVISDSRLPINLARTNVIQAYSAVPAFNGGTTGSTPPFTVDSTQRVTNLNADLLDGFDSLAFALASHTHDTSAIISGTFADARFPSFIPRTYSSSTYSGNNTFSGINIFNGSVELNNANNVIFGDGSGLTSLNATQIISGQLADSRLPNTVARLANANTFANSQTITTTNQFALTINASSTGGTWSLLRNTGTNGREWNFISTGSSNGEGPGKLLVRDGTAGGVRMTFDTDGDVGIGTTSPTSRLAVTGTIESTTGGFKFPDGTIQTTRAVSTPGPQGPVGPQGPIGPTGPQGPQGTGGGGMQAGLEGVYTNNRLIVANLVSGHPNRGGITIPGGYGRTGLVVTDDSFNTRVEIGMLGSHGNLKVTKSNDQRLIETYVDSGGNGVFNTDVIVTNQLFTAVKFFRVENPADSATSINYACLEGPEAALYTRGTATLNSGITTIILPSHFTSLASEQGMTVQLTPRSADSMGLAAIDITPERIIVRELMRGTGTYEFDYTITAVRKGYEDFQVIQPRDTIQTFPAARVVAPAPANSSLPAPRVESQPGTN